MRLLLDECVPRRLKRELPGHDVTTVSEAGWAGVKNGELLFEDVDLRGLGYECVEFVASGKAIHVVLRRDAR